MPISPVYLIDLDLTSMCMQPDYGVVAIPLESCLFSTTLYVQRETPLAIRLLLLVTRARPPRPSPLQPLAFTSFMVPICYLIGYAEMVAASSIIHRRCRSMTLYSTAMPSSCCARASFAPAFFFASYSYHSSLTS
jgi:hypothetical protein